MRLGRCLGAAFLLCALLAGGSAGATESLLNRLAPVFALPDLHGERVDLAKDRGKVVLLNFWATWCGPCRLEMPRFMAWQKQYGARGLQVVGVSIDDSAAPVRPFVEKMRLNYPVVMGSAELGERYGGVLGVPVTFLIDRHGVVRARFAGEERLDAMEKELEKLLAE
ncbi:MAG TPA: TlpA disulfide reductase family protein [Acidobacteriaceae bacterium]|jgi:peroxiredoxin|nr:TlpA disulfide reductase family protein [Acidobacteriaceae bacterium]